MMVPMKKSQSAMEYLMTYGWAILIIAVVLGAIYSLGLFNATAFGPHAPPGSCQIFRPNGPGTSQYIDLAGACTNLPPQYGAQFGGIAKGAYVAISPNSYVNFAGANIISASAWINPQQYVADGDMGTILTKSNAYYFQLDGVGDVSPATLQFRRVEVTCIPAT